MSYAIVPSLFDAILLGKKTPVYDWPKSYSTPVNDDQIEYPLSLELESTTHSFTLSLRFKETGEVSIAGFVSNNVNHTISAKGEYLQNYAQSLTIMKVDKHVKMQFNKIEF